MGQILLEQVQGSAGDLREGLVWPERQREAHYIPACYSRRMWDSYKALLGEHPMERPNFCFTDWYALNNNGRDAAGNGFKYSPLSLSWNVLGLAE